MAGVAQGRLDQVGEPLLVAADRLDVAQRDSQRRAVEGQVKSRHAGSFSSGANAQNSLPSGSAQHVPVDLVVRCPQHRGTARDQRVDVRADHVPVHAVLDGLGLGHRHELPDVERQPRDTGQPPRSPVGCRDDLGVQHIGPPPGLRLGVDAVDDQRRRLALRAVEDAQLRAVGVIDDHPRLTTAHDLAQLVTAEGDQRAGRAAHEVEMNPVLHRLRLAHAVDPHRLLRTHAAQHPVAVVHRAGFEIESVGPEPRHLGSGRDASMHRSFQRAVAMDGRRYPLGLHGRVGACSTTTRPVTDGDGVGFRPRDGSRVRRRPRHVVSRPAASAPVDDAPAPAELAALAGKDDRRGVRLDVVRTEIDLDTAPQDVPDAYLRLHLLSHRLVRPHGLDVSGIFGVLTNVVWTNHRSVRRRRSSRRRARGCARAGTVTVLRRRQVPADGRLRAADRRAHRATPTACGSVPTSPSARR